MRASGVRLCISIPGKGEEPADAFMNVMIPSEPGISQHEAVPR